MLTVTDSAAQEIAAMLEQYDSPDGAAVRLIRDEQGIGMTIDEPAPSDVTIDHADKPLVVMDAEVSELLAERTLHVQKSEQGLQFQLN
jgi:Fe-S cluster assembly iron-binding protein IscA